MSILVVGSTGLAIHTQLVTLALSSSVSHAVSVSKASTLPLDTSAMASVLNVT